MNKKKDTLLLCKIWISKPKSEQLGPLAVYDTYMYIKVLSFDIGIVILCNLRVQANLKGRIVQVMIMIDSTEIVMSDISSGSLYTAYF